MNFIRIDNNYWLLCPGAPIPDFYLLPNKISEKVPFHMASFYADCIAFEHEFPTIALPSKIKLTINDIPWNLKPPKRTDLKDQYIQFIQESLEAASNSLEGIWSDRKSKFDVDLILTGAGYPVVDIDYSKYANVKTAIHLYNAALKQPDPLFAYLCYYRAIEHLASNNGKQWIENKLNSNQLEYKLDVWCEGQTIFIPSTGKSLLPLQIEKFIRKRKIKNSEGDLNIVEVTRAHAKIQLRKLQTSLSNNKIASRLYNENRCGIAHGGTHGQNIKKHDLGEDFVDVINDLKLIRYLSRLFIEERI